MPLTVGRVYEAKKKIKKVSEASKDLQANDLDFLVRKSQKIIYEVKGTFPFEMFPDKLTICPNRISIARNGFLTKFEYPMQIENITGARIFRNVFFATLYIDTFGLQTPAPIRYLKVDEARMARRYILALIECKKSNIDLSKYPINELREKLKAIGTVRE